ncbi:hypothetical protein FB566_4146 [Stackebrandtia endophytica]|uniref:Uncharacterized protein n=1 Tax=Stackebrandtia endophytica TaxID=1496996 RepID=A0A543B146_9ACTN|nr:hypothetical protein [Stackebrandtia endophytica]TQL78557.1 hypothetical protein FB566_4146 [Stackebrandtia endophytica]
MADPVTDTEITEAAKEVVDAARKKVTAEAAQRKKGGGFGSNLGPGLSEQLTDADRAAIEEGLSWIVERFETYHTPHPKEFDLLIEKMDIVAAAFGKSDKGFAETDLGMITVAQEYVSEWDGALATNFSENFLSKMPIVMENQGLLARLLHNEMLKTKAMYETRRKNAVDIANDAVKAIEAINESKGIGLKVALAVIISVGTFMTLGTGTFAMVGAAAVSGATIGGPFIPEDKEKVPLGADTVEEVLDNLREALKKLDEKVDEQENTLIEAMERTDLMVYPEVYGQDKNEKATHMLPIKPRLMGASQSEIESGLVQFK